MAKNTGKDFEDTVYGIIENLVKSNQFMLSEPYVKILRKPKYYSKDRDANIICDISVEKYMEDPDRNSSLRPAIIVVIECKDYAGSIPVDDVEEFHTKLQQIGADNTKGIMITHTGSFQKSALTFARSKGIALVRLLPDDQASYILHMMHHLSYSNLSVGGRTAAEIIRALTKKDYQSTEGERFYSLTGESSLDKLIRSLLT